MNENTLGLSKILIAGESNSVIKNGWISGFKSVFVDELIINLSIGSTGILNAIRVLEDYSLDIKHDLSCGVKFFIIDSFIQDSSFFSDDLALYENTLHSVFSCALLKFKCPLIYICFESIGDWRIEQKKVLMDSCNKYGVLFYDTHQYLMDYCEKFHIGLASIFLDSAHPKHEVAEMVGRDFANYIISSAEVCKEKFKKFQYNRSLGKQNCFIYYDYSYFYSHHETITKEVVNSLVNFKSIVLDNKLSVIKIQSNEAHVIPFALFLNIAGTTGCLEIQGAKTILKNLNTNYYKKDGKLIWARPIHSLVSADPEGNITFRARIPGAYKDIEDTEHCDLMPSSLVTEPLVELISIIFVDLSLLFRANLSDWLLSKIKKIGNEKTELVGKFINSYEANWDLIKRIKKSKTKNLALDCHTTQSSYYKIDSAFGLSGCNGKKTGSYGFHTLEETNPWWCIDLGEITEIQTVICYNRIDAASERVKFLRILLSVDGHEWRICYQHNGNFAFGGINKSGAPPLIVSFDKFEITKYIKIDLQDNNYLHLDEVEVY